MIVCTYVLTFFLNLVPSVVSALLVSKVRETISFQIFWMKNKGKENGEAKPPPSERLYLTANLSKSESVWPQVDRH